MTGLPAAQWAPGTESAPTLSFSPTSDPRAPCPRRDSLPASPQAGPCQVLLPRPGGACRDPNQPPAGAAQGGEPRHSAAAPGQRTRLFPRTGDTGTSPTHGPSPLQRPLGAGRPGTGQAAGAPLPASRCRFPRPVLVPTCRAPPAAPGPVPLSSGVVSPAHSSSSSSSSPSRPDQDTFLETLAMRGGGALLCRPCLTGRSCDRRLAALT